MDGRDIALMVVGKRILLRWDGKIAGPEVIGIARDPFALVGKIGIGRIDDAIHDQVNGIDAGALVINFIRIGKRFLCDAHGINVPALVIEKHIMAVVVHHFPDAEILLVGSRYFFGYHLPVTELPCSLIGELVWLFAGGNKHQTSQNKT